MVRSVVITEKRSQQQNVLAAVQSRYGRVLAARGHLIELEEPEDRNPAWSQWSFDVLRPDGDGFYRFKATQDESGKRLLDDIINALSNADRLIISTDADREGQAIGENIARFAKFRGEIWRVMFTSEDEKTIQEAFANMRPNAEFLPLYSAAYARAQADQIANLSKTRAATLALKPKWMSGALGVGRVKTVVLGLVASRELEIQNHVEQEYWTLWMDVSSSDGKTVRLHHKPKPEDRIFDISIAREIEAAARGFQGPVEVKTERKKAKPPRLMDLPTLQKRAAAYGWSAQKTLDIAQSLYESHKIISYPRAETKYLPEALIPFMPKLLADLRGIDIFKNLTDFPPTIRKGKSGFFSDAGLDGAAHHAIIPNPNTAATLPSVLPKLSDDERKLFDLVARSVVSALSPDHVYDRTEIAALVPARHEQRNFNVVGRVTVDPGWKAAFGVDEPADEDPEAQEDGGSLPAFADGEIVTAGDAGAEKATTTPPPRYTEGSLIEAMTTVYKLLPEGSPERARLQAAKGIGTPATRASILEGLKRQKQIEVVKKGQLRPTELGMGVYEIFRQAAPEVIDPIATAELEFQLDEIMAGRSDPRRVLDTVTENTRQFVETMKRRHESGHGAVDIKREPTAKMVEAAESRAKAQGVKLTRDQKKDYGALSAFLGPMAERRPDGTYAPSDRQVEAARSLSERLGIPLDDAILDDRAKLSTWMDAAVKRRDQSPASPKQMEWVRKLVDEGADPPKGYPDEVTASVAKKFLDANMGKRKPSAAGAKPGASKSSGRKPAARSAAKSAGPVRYDPKWFSPT